MMDNSDSVTYALNEDVISPLRSVIEDTSWHAVGHEDLIRHLELACAAFEAERSRRHSLTFCESHGALNARQLASAKRVLAEFAFDNGVSIRAARALSMSPAHFSRLFKASTGLSVRRWIIDLRMDRAKTLLLETCQSIKDIALSCGYTEQCHFTRTFTREIGISPGSWRRLFTALPSGRTHQL